MRFKKIIFGATRAYVAISTGTANWTKGLNAELDAAINNKLSLD